MSYPVGVMLVVLASVLWSAMGLAIRQLEDADTWQVLFWRSAGLIPVLFLYVAWASGGQPLRRVRQVGWAGVLGGLGLVLAFAGAIYAIQATTVANAVFLFSASPFLAAGLGWILLREPVRRATWGAMALALVGLWVMVRGGLEAGALAGNLAALISALGFAVFSVALRWRKVEDMMPAVILGGAFSLAVAGVVLTLGGQGPAVSLHDGAIAMAMGAVLLAGGMVMYTLGSRVIPAAELTLISMVEILLAPIWVWLALGETARGATLVGGAIILSAIALNALSGARRKPLAPPLA